MSKVDAVAFEYAKENGTLGLDYNQIYDAVKYGYKQAEKDLELTWRDMEKIVEIANLLEIEWLKSTPWDGTKDWGFYKEVLKRFKSYGKKEI